MADTIKTNLGPVTAYADAKAHGYTGTREEFGVLLANAGLNLKAAETAKADAETAQQAAASSASSASTSASTATTQAAAAKSSADAAASSATAAKASEAAAEKSAQGAAASESAAKAAQTAAETAKANADTAASNAAANATAAANSAVDAKKTLESIPADYSALSGKVDENTSGISELKEDLADYAFYKNVFGLSGIVEDTYIDITGELKNYNGFRVTNFIPVPDNAKNVTVLNYATMNGIKYPLDAGVLATYDSDKNYVKTELRKGELGRQTIVLNGVSYIRVNAFIYDKDDSIVIFNEDTSKMSKIEDDIYALNQDNLFLSVGRNDSAGVINRSGTITSHAAFGYTDFVEVPLYCDSVVYLNKATLSDTDYTMEDFEFAMYDSDKNFIATKYGNTNISYVIEKIEPNAKYIRFNYCVNNLLECIIRFISKNKDIPSKTSDLVNDSGFLKYKWNNKTGNFLGDSLTAQGRFTGKMSSLYGIVVNNYGVSGTTISNIIANNYFSSRIDGMNDNCDFVFVLGGTNDWGLSATLGTKTDTSLSTFYGGLYDMFSKLRTKFPTKPIFVSTIPQRNWTQTSDQSSGIDSNSKGNSVEEFNDAIRYMAHRYGCTVIDAYGECGIVVDNLSTYTVDNLHFNDNGGTRFATFVKDKMEIVTPY